MIQTKLIEPVGEKPRKSAKGTRIVPHLLKPYQVYRGNDKTLDDHLGLDPVKDMTPLDDDITKGVYQTQNELESALIARIDDLEKMASVYERSIIHDTDSIIFKDHRPVQKSIIGLQKEIEALIDSAKLYEDNTFDMQGGLAAKYDMLQTYILGLELIRSERYPEFIKVIDIRAHNPNEHMLNRQIKMTLEPIKGPEFDPGYYV